MSDCNLQFFLGYARLLAPSLLKKDVIQRRRGWVCIAV